MPEIAYITKANAAKILALTDQDVLSRIQGSIWKQHLFMLSDRDNNHMKGFIEFLKDPQQFLSHYYRRVEVADTFRFLRSEQKPAFHRTKTCGRLLSDFQALYVPTAIQHRGPQEVGIFRDWVRNTYPSIYNTNKVEEPEQFIFAIQRQFPYVGEIRPDVFEAANTGIEFMGLTNLADLEREIDFLIVEEKKFFDDNIPVQHVINEFGAWSFLGFQNEPLRYNNTRWNDAQVKEFLRFYHTKFKKPVRIHPTNYILPNPAKCLG